jgi:hypothetical protein
MKLIDKDAVVAEIESLRRTTFTNFDEGVNATVQTLLETLDTFEVKKLDLEKEIKEVQRNYKTIEKYAGYPCTMYANNIEWIAKHFFELGIKVAQKGK